MATNTDGVLFQANFKTPAGSLLNLYARTPAEFEDALNAFPDYIAKIVAVEQSLNGASTVAAAVPVAAPAQQPPAYTPQPQAPSYPQQAAPTGGEHLCEHGIPMKLIPAGISKASGKPYKAFYACAQPRGQQCNSRVSV